MPPLFSPLIREKKVVNASHTLHQYRENQVFKMVKETIETDAYKFSTQKSNNFFFIIDNKQQTTNK